MHQIIQGGTAKLHHQLPYYTLKLVRVLIMTANMVLVSYHRRDLERITYASAILVILVTICHQYLAAAASFVYNH